MKKTWIQTVVLALCLCFLLGVAAACVPNHDDEPSSAEPSSATEVSSAPEEPTEEPVSVEEESSEAPSEQPSVKPAEPSSAPPVSKNPDLPGEIVSFDEPNVGPLPEGMHIPTSRGEVKSDAFYANYVQKTDLPWNLRLINKVNKLDGNITDKLRDVGSGRLFDDRAADALDRMVADCRKAGNRIWAQSTYRTVDFQARLLENQVQKNINLGYNRAESERLALEWVAPPGGSEHNLGLAVDFNEITDSFRYTSTYAWLQKHAAEYGFIHRYTKDREAITQYHEEPWHYRYIGREHAMAMKKLGIPTLEEYVYLLESQVA